MCGQVDGDCAHRAAPLLALGRQHTYISPTVHISKVEVTDEAGDILCHTKKQVTVTDVPVNNTTLMKCPKSWRIVREEHRESLLRIPLFIFLAAHMS